MAIKIARVPDMVLGARLGGVTLRGSGSRANLTAEERTDLTRAQAVYKEMRAKAADDDLTPELYLSSVLQEYGQYAEMKPLVASMQKRQPGSGELKDLAAAVEKWAAQR